MKPSKICFLIEDDIDDREIFDMALKEVDTTMICHYAENGVIALEKLYANENFTPSIIIIDMNMPMMNGLQCLQEIKKIRRLEKVPVYIYSTAAHQNGIDEVKKLGAADFILKPARFKGLKELLSVLLQPLNASPL
jgi:DNA-binding NtrC family response regulator